MASKPSPASKPIISARVMRVTAVILIAALTFAVYWHTLDAPFVFDDEGNIRDNPHVRVEHLSWAKLKATITKSVNSQRPLSNISFALNYWTSGGEYNLRHYRMVNIAIHALCGIMVYVLAMLTLALCRTDGKQRVGRRQVVGALIIAGLWVLHPLHSQSVIYIVQRMNSMAVMFAMVSINCYIIGRRTHRTPRAWWFAGAGLAFFCGLASKEIAITVPLLVWLYEWYFFRSLSRDWLMTGLKYFAVPAIIILPLLLCVYTDGEPLRVLAKYDDRDFTLLERLLTQHRVVWLYLSLLFLPLPSRFNLDYDFPVSLSLLSPPSTLIAIVATLGLFYAAFRLAPKHRILSFAILWFFINLALESSFIALEMAFEHRTYLPSVLVVVAFWSYVESWCAPIPKLAPVLALLIAAGLGGATVSRGKVWCDRVSLWADCAAKSPKKARPHFNLAQSCEAAGQIERAVAEFHKTLQIDPEHAEAHNNYGGLLQREYGKSEEAKAHFQKAIEHRKKYAEPYNNLGTVLANEGKIDEAVVNFRHAVKLKPDFPQAISQLGMALTLQGNYKEGLPFLQQAIKLAPNDQTFRNNLAVATNHWKKQQPTAPGNE